MNNFLFLFSIFHLCVNAIPQAFSPFSNVTTVKPSPSTTLLTTAKNVPVLNQTKTTVPTLEDTKEPGPAQNVNLLSFFSKTPVIGSACKNDSDCSSHTNSICVNGACQCKSDFVKSSNNNTCLKKAKKLEDGCEDDTQCDAIYGETELTVCVAFKCVCSANANLINNNCYKKTVLGRSCKVDEECSSIPYSYCFQSVCACEPEFSPDLSGTHCYPVNGTVNGTNIDCTRSSLVCQVLGKDAYCNNGTCVCLPGYHLSSGKCVPEKKLNDLCYDDDDCIVDMEPNEPNGARECKTGKCSCIKGYKSFPEHNICKSGSSVLKTSLLLVIACLFFFV